MAKRGRTGKVFYGGEEVNLARDVNTSLSATEIDITSRDTSGWKAFLQGLKEMGLTFDIISDPTNDAQAAIQAAYVSGAEAAFKVEDEDGYGYGGDCIVSGFDRAEPLDGAVTHAVTLKPSGTITIETPPASS